MKPPFGTLNATLAKLIGENMPPHSLLVEPYGDGGTLVLHQRRKRAKSHVLNIRDEELFQAFMFAKNGSRSDLKRFDWVSSPDTFEKAISVNATEGPEFFWKWLYVKKFGMAMDPEAEPTWDPLSAGKDLNMALFGLPLMRVGLKNTELVNGEPDGVFGRAGGSSFCVMLPRTPEDTEAAKSKLGSLSGQYFYAGKIDDVERAIEMAGSMKGTNVSAAKAASIMMNTFALAWNYDTTLQPIDPEVMESGQMEM